MADFRHKLAVMRGYQAVQQWRARNPGKQLDLREVSLFPTNLSCADLRGADLTGADLADLDLDRADLSGANLTQTNLTMANLRKANLSHALLNETELVRADMTGANLTGCKMEGACLIGANFDGANLESADFTATNCRATLFVDLDLSAAIGLDRINHTGPSEVGIGTLLKSNGRIPREFLIGCGVPEHIADYIPSLIGSLEPIQFHSCFLSYSSKDLPFCKLLYQRLRERKVRIWFAEEGLQGGKMLAEQLEHAVRSHDRLLVVLSKDSIASSWVEHELRWANDIEQREARRVLFPIRLIPFGQICEWKCIDSRTGADLAEYVRHFYIPDFGDWEDPDCFEKEFARLADALRRSI